MTRHEFLLLSHALRSAAPALHMQHAAHRQQHERDARAIAAALAVNNRAFDVDRFLRDAGVSVPAKGLQP